MSDQSRDPMLVLGIPERSSLVGLGAESNALRSMVCPCPCLSMLHLCHCLPLNEYQTAWIFLTFCVFP